MWLTEELTDKTQILAYLETDRLYAAYAIGDLEPGMFEQCTWAGAEKAGQMGALALHFRGLAIPALFLMGNPDGLRTVLARTLHPERVYLTCLDVHVPVTREFYAWDSEVHMWRMALDVGRFQPVGGACGRLNPTHADHLAALFKHGGGDAFSPAQMEGGVFYGVFEDDHLVSVAGTHLVSPTYGVAAVGNVFTHPDYRGRGYGTAATSAVVDDLFRSGIRDVVLNVGQANTSAIRIYERLGFTRYCPFLEGLAIASPQ
jgi:GNAT superfamily N-acetyltransferase